MASLGTAIIEVNPEQECDVCHGDQYLQPCYKCMDGILPQARGLDYLFFEGTFFYKHAVIYFRDYQIPKLEQGVEVVFANDVRLKFKNKTAADFVNVLMGGRN